MYLVDCEKCDINNTTIVIYQNVAHVALVITDGESSDSVKTITAATRLRTKGITVITLGVGNVQWLDTDELEGMASHPQTRNMFLVDDYNSLFTISDIIISTVCNGKFKPRLLMSGTLIFGYETNKNSSTLSKLSTY